jgi:repressor LexA
MKGLTDRQAKVLRFIYEFINKHCYSPTVREIASYFCISAKAAQDHLVVLKRKSVLKSEGSKPRTITIPDTVKYS